MTGFIGTAEFFEEFFERCIQKEAITKEERIEILKQMVSEKKLKELNELELQEKLKNKKVLVVENKGRKNG